MKKKLIIFLVLFTASNSYAKVVADLMCEYIDDSIVTYSKGNTHTSFYNGKSHRILIEKKLENNGILSDGAYLVIEEGIFYEYVPNAIVDKGRLFFPADITCEINPKRNQSCISGYDKIKINRQTGEMIVKNYGVKKNSSVFNRSKLQLSEIMAEAKLRWEKKYMCTAQDFKF